MAGGTNKAKRQHEQIMSSLDGSRQMIAILEQRIPELHRRDEQQTGPDGYSTTTGGSSESTISTRNVSSSTETAGMRLAERGVEPDALHTNRVRADALIHEASGLLATAASLVINGLKLGETERGRQSHLSSCGNQHCGEQVTGAGEDRLRDGRCPKCYSFRYRTGREWTPRATDASVSL